MYGCQHNVDIGWTWRAEILARESRIASGYQIVPELAERWKMKHVNTIYSNKWQWSTAMFLLSKTHHFLGQTCEEIMMGGANHVTYVKWSLPFIYFFVIKRKCRLLNKSNRDILGWPITLSITTYLVLWTSNDLKS